jgi:aldehyde dehydrogenase (NAD+)
MAAQWASVQRLIERSIDEGALLVASGTGKPTGLEKG